MAVQNKLRFGLFVALHILVCGMLVHLAFYPVEWRRLAITDVLDSPVAVAAWSEEGLHLTNHRTVQLPGFRRLPAESSALAHAIERGVELGSDGRVYALVRVYSTCGGSGWIRRLDLADMLIFLGEGGWSGAPDDEALATELQELRERAWEEQRGEFSDHGWNPSAFWLFNYWRERWKPASMSWR
jgi:hypothetical protein